MILEGLVLSNYLSFRDESRVDLGQPVTVLCGRNNAGKSNVLSAIMRVTKGRAEGVDPTHLSFSRNAAPIRAHLQLHRDVWSTALRADFSISAVSYGLQVQPTSNPAWELSVESVGDAAPLVFSVGPDLTGLGTSGTPLGALHTEQNKIRTALANTYLLRAERHAHMPDKGASGQYELQPDCRNILQVLNSLAARRPDTYSRIVTHLTELLPGLSGVRAPLEANTSNLTGETVEQSMPGVTFSWSEVASGTRHLAAILTLLVSTPEHSLILIEEPESFLHPEVAVDLFRLCERIAVQEDKQVVLTTHSPVLMEMAGAARLNVVVRDLVSGASSIEHLGRLAERALRDRGILSSYMLAPFKPGLIPAAIVIVEGRDDVEAWTAFLDLEGLTEMDVLAVSPGQGEGEAKRLALFLRHLQAAGIRSGPFVLVIDSDEHRDRRIEQLLAEGLRDTEFHVLEKNVLEDYLLDARSIAAHFGLPVQEAEQIVKESGGGKEGLNTAIRRISPQLVADAKLKGELARRLGPVEDLHRVIDLIREKLAENVNRMPMEPTQSQP